MCTQDFTIHTSSKPEFREYTSCIRKLIKPFCTDLITYEVKVECPEMLKFIFTYKTEIFLIIIEALYIFLYMQ